MARKISYREYKRRVFNTAVLECFCKIHGQVLNSGSAETQYDQKRLNNMAENICKNFYEDELKLSESTLASTKERLSKACYFLHECGEVCEEIAEDKADQAEKEDQEIEDDQKIELSNEEEAVLDQLFQSKNPTPQIDQIRDATVSALMAEEDNAKEARDAIDLAKAQVASGDDPKAFEETVNRLNSVGPTSLMNAIMTNISAQAIREATSAGHFTSINDVMQENADGIKDRACMIYALYEMSNVFGIHTYTPSEIKRLSYDIFYEK